MRVPLFIKTPTYQSGVSHIFLWSLLALCIHRPISKFTLGTPKVVNQDSINHSNQEKSILLLPACSTAELWETSWHRGCNIQFGIGSSLKYCSVTQKIWGKVSQFWQLRELMLCFILSNLKDYGKIK